MVVAVVGFEHQRAAGAAEDGQVSVARVTVEVGAALGAVEDVAIQVPDFDADGKPVFLRVLGIVRVLERHGEEVVLQGYNGAVMGSGIHPDGNVGVAFFLQFVLVDEDKVAGTVVVDGGPFAADVHVDGAVAHEVNAQEAGVPFDQVEVVAVFLEVDAAVEDVDGVGVGGNGDGEASALGGIDAAGAGAEVELVLVDVAGLEIDDGEVTGFAVTDEQSAGEFSGVFVSVLHGVVVVRPQGRASRPVPEPPVLPRRPHEWRRPRPRCRADLPRERRGWPRC